MKIDLFGLKIEINKKNKLSKMGSAAKVEQSKKKIFEAYEEIQNKQLKFSEYRLSKLSGLSINTIKKYRDYIATIRSKDLGLFDDENI
jgi:hypothetical protein